MSSKLSILQQIGMAHIREQTGDSLRIQPPSFDVGYMGPDCISSTKHTQSDAISTRLLICSIMLCPIAVSIALVLTAHAPKPSPICRDTVTLRSWPSKSGMAASKMESHSYDSLNRSSYILGASTLPRKPDCTVSR